MTEKGTAGPGPKRVSPVILVLKRIKMAQSAGHKLSVGTQGALIRIADHMIPDGQKFSTRRSLKLLAKAIGADRDTLSKAIAKGIETGILDGRIWNSQRRDGVTRRDPDVIVLDPARLGPGGVGLSGSEVSGGFLPPITPEPEGVSGGFLPRDRRVSSAAVRTPSSPPKNETEGVRLVEPNGTATATQTATPRNDEPPRNPEPASPETTEGEGCGVEASPLPYGTEVPPPSSAAPPSNPLRDVDVMGILGHAEPPAAGTARKDWNVASGNGSAPWRSALDCLHQDGVTVQDLEIALRAYRAAMDGKDSLPSVAFVAWQGYKDGQPVGPGQGSGLPYLVKPDRIRKLAGDQKVRERFGPPRSGPRVLTLREQDDEENRRQAREAGQPEPTQSELDAQWEALEQRGRRERASMSADKRAGLIDEAVAFVRELLAAGPVSVVAFGDATRSAGLEFGDVSKAKTILGVDLEFGGGHLAYALPVATAA